MENVKIDPVATAVKLYAAAVQDFQEYSDSGVVDPARAFAMRCALATTISQIGIMTALAQIVVAQGEMARLLTEQHLMRNRSVRRDS